MRIERYAGKRTFLTGKLENSPSTLNGLGTFREGSQTTPKRSPPNTSWNILKV